MSGPLDPEIQQHIRNLEALIGRRVRAEQLTDQLTGLPNGAALDEHLRERLEERKRYWLAFVEVDHFKRINDLHGYSNADALLKAIARILVTAAETTMLGAVAYRAHGDEFYLLGEASQGEDMHSRLDLLRMQVESTRVRGASGLMQCTVSVGWLTCDDISASGDPRELHGFLELAVGEAKRARNAVVRYSADLRRSAPVSRRADCSRCECKFTFDIKRSDERTGQAWCPNCGESVVRPPLPTLPDTVVPPKV